MDFYVRFSKEKRIGKIFSAFSTTKKVAKKIVVNTFCRIRQCVSNDENKGQRH